MLSEHGRWAQSTPSQLPGVDIAADHHLAFAAKARDALERSAPWAALHFLQFTVWAADSVIYRAILNELRPKRRIEVGSGFLW
jgi:hypothetical protein